MKKIMQALPSMRKLAILLFALFFFAIHFPVATASADLTVIGTASIGANGFQERLIYDNDSPFGPIVWLDSPNLTTIGSNTWYGWENYIKNLYVALNIDPKYAISWDGDWRLSIAAGGSGFDQTGSEFGHLYYTELGNVAGETGLDNSGPFRSLQETYYWTGTEAEDVCIDGECYATAAYTFMTGAGSQGTWDKGSYMPLPMYVRSGHLVPTPIPAAVWLFATGLLGLFGVRRKIRK